MSKKKIPVTLDLLVPTKIEEITLAGVEAAAQLPRYQSMKPKTQQQKEHKFKLIDGAIGELLGVNPNLLASKSGDIMTPLIPLINNAIKLVNDEYIRILMGNDFITSVKMGRKTFNYKDAGQLPWHIWQDLHDTEIKKILEYKKDRCFELRHIGSVLSKTLWSKSEKPIVKQAGRDTANWDLIAQKKVDFMDLPAREAMQLYCFFLSSIDAFWTHLKQSLTNRVMSLLQEKRTIKTTDGRPTLKM